MKPDVNHFLGVAAMHLATHTIPALGRAYDQSSAQVLAGMLMAVSEEFDRAAARRVEENRALRQLFAEAAAAVTDAGLRARLEQAAASTDSDLSVSALERANAELRQLLIDLHIHVEGVDAPDARRVEAAIWRELVASTERRRLMMGPF